MIIDKLNEIISDNQSIDKIDSQEFSVLLDLLDKHHKKNSREYMNVSNSLFQERDSLEIIYKPYIHASSFKREKLISVEESEIIKTMYSSGTSGAKSKVMLDAITAQNQRKVLAKIFEAYMKLKRPLMLAIEKDEEIKKRDIFNARKAAIIGFGQMCKKVVGVLNKDNQVDMNIIRGVLEKYEEQDLIIFGFTGRVWESLKAVKWPKDIQEHFSNKCSILHGGGWKNLEKMKVSRNQFNNELKDITKVKNIKNYYGMIEQTGSIFMECEHGLLHENRFTRILSRNPYTLDLSSKGEVGVAQVLSLLPYSYPGMSILTDDMVKIVSQSCPCGRHGNAFEIIGRLKNTEVRGCSDAYKK